MDKVINIWDLKGTRAILLLVFLFAAPSGKVFSQINIANTSPLTENFDAMGSSATAALPANWKISPAGAAAPTWAAGGNFTVVNAQASTGSPTSGGRYNWGTSSTERALGIMTSGSYASPNSIMAFFRNTNTSSISQLTISYDLERYRINSAAASVQFYYSTDGSTWTSVPAGDIAAATIGTGTSAYGYTHSVFNVAAFNITGLSIANNSDVYFRWNLNTTGSNSQGIGIDNFSLTAAFSAPGPLISLSTSSLTGFNYIFGAGPSAEQTFTCSGSNLTANITLTAPADYEISTSSGAGFGASVTLTQTAGNVAATAIYVRLRAGLAAGTYNTELITASSTGASNQTVSCDGTVSVIITGVVINEIFVNPSDANDGSNAPNTSEWVELYNSTAAAVDISCWFLTDGDFAVTIPSGTMLASNDYYTIASAAGSGETPDLDWALCGCTSGLSSQVGIFTNGNEQFLLYNSGGVLVDAIIWGAGQLPGSMNTSAVGSCGAASVTFPAAGSFENIGTVADGIVNERDTDGSNTWQQTASGTFDASNGTVPMPVELISFGAEYNKKAAVSISWTTASELNNDYFTVEKSADGIEFVPVFTTKGAGNSSSIKHYSGADANPTKGISYYRLAQTDYDGTTVRSGMVAIHLNNDFGTIYPNPATDVLSISIPGISFEILNLQGMVVLKGPRPAIREDVFQLDIRGLQAGTYILKSISGNETTQTLFIKQ